MGFSGCAALLAPIVVSTPNRFNALASPRNPLPTIERIRGVDGWFFVPVGPPEATLAVYVVDPPESAPKGTILVIHGFLSKSNSMLKRARELAEVGYRSVLVDLRGNGRSSGKFVTYGVQESSDLTQVIDDLERRGLICGNLGASGDSYGAATVIHLAAIDARVRAVVAVAPFDSMRCEISHAVRNVVPLFGRLISEATVQRAVDRGGRMAGIDPDIASASAANRDSTAPTLILHGDKDKLVPMRDSQRIYAAGRDHSQLIILPGLGHISIWRDKEKQVRDLSIDWFDRYLCGEGGSDEGGSDEGYYDDGYYDEEPLEEGDVVGEPIEEMLERPADVRRKRTARTADESESETKPKSKARKISRR